MTHIFISSCGIGYVISVCTMKAQRGSKAMAVLILNLDARQRWVVYTTPMPLYTCKETYLLGGWVGPRASLDHLEKWKISCHCWDSKHMSSNPQSSHSTNYCRFLLSAVCNGFTITFEYFMWIILFLYCNIFVYFALFWLTPSCVDN